MKNGQENKQDSGVKLAEWYALMKYLLVLPAISENSIYNRALVVNIDRMTLLHPAIRAV